MCQVIFQQPEIVVEIKVIPHVHSLDFMARCRESAVGNGAAERLYKWGGINDSKEKKKQKNKKNPPSFMRVICHRVKL